jgi:hypothetical protein
MWTSITARFRGVCHNFLYLLCKGNGRKRMQRYFISSYVGLINA